MIKQSILNLEKKCCICDGELIYVEFYYICKECRRSQMKIGKDMILLKASPSY